MVAQLLYEYAWQHEQRRRRKLYQQSKIQCTPKEKASKWTLSEPIQRLEKKSQNLKIARNHVTENVDF